MTSNSVHHLQLSTCRKNPFRIISRTPSFPPASITEVFDMSSTHQPSTNPSAGPSSTPSAIPATGNSQPVNATTMANAINDLVKSNLPSRVKIREPDPFDGSDPKKLCTFLLQCKLNFLDHKYLFQDETTKVNYVLSYLKGSALDCFEPGLLDPLEPPWCSDFDLFSEELEANFSTFNPIREAKAELEGLHMQENHQATKYFIKFMQLSSRVYWGEAALLQQAYNGLAKQIKNEMVHHNKPTTLSGLQRLMQAIDAHYWEHGSTMRKLHMKLLPPTLPVPPRKAAPS